MTNDKFNKKETEAVRNAFSSASHYWDTQSWKHDWNIAFEHERRDCTTTDWARAIMLESFLQGYEQHETLRPSDLIAIREGARIATMLGSRLRDKEQRLALKGKPHEAETRLVTEVREACIVIQASRIRAFNEWRAKIEAEEANDKEGENILM